MVINYGHFKSEAFICLLSGQDMKYHFQTTNVTAFRNLGCIYLTACHTWPIRISYQDVGFCEEDLKAIERNKTSTYRIDKQHVTFLRAAAVQNHVKGFDA